VRLPTRKGANGVSAATRTVGAQAAFGIGLRRGDLAQHLDTLLDLFGQAQAVATGGATAVVPAAIAAAAVPPTGTVALTTVEPAKPTWVEAARAAPALAHRLAILWDTLVALTYDVSATGGASAAGTTASGLTPADCLWKLVVHAADAAARVPPDLVPAVHLLLLAPALAGLAPNRLNARVGPWSGTLPAVGDCLNRLSLCGTPEHEFVAFFAAIGYLTWSLSVPAS